MDFALALAMQAQATDAGRVTRQRLIYDALRNAILDGRLTAGARLPATRVLADELGCARNTVLRVYERLSDEGLLLADRQGSHVPRFATLQAAPGGGAHAVLASARPLAGTDACGDVASLPRDAAAPASGERARAAAYGLRPGLPALDAFPLLQWRRSVARAWRGIDPDLLGYGAAVSHPVLRRAIADYLRVARNVRCSPGQIIVTDGTQTGLDLCARVLAAPGDVVWIENPGYDGARVAFAAAGLRVVPIAVDAEGLAPTPHDWTATPPRLIYVTPSHQYPLGAVLSLSRRLALLERARALGAWIIEDDYDCEFRYRGTTLPAVQGLAVDAPVVYAGTFSKTLFPALRLAFLVAPHSAHAAMAAMLTRQGRQGRIAEQLTLADFIDRGHYARHLRRMRALYRDRRDALIAALERRLSDTLDVSGGAAGMHVSARLRTPVRDASVSAAASLDGLRVQPLSSYCIGGPGASLHNGFVLGYANLPACHADGIVAQLADAIARATTASSG